MAILRYMGWESHEYHRPLLSDKFVGVKIGIYHRWFTGSAEYYCGGHGGYFPAMREVMLDDNKARNLLSSSLSVMGVTSSDAIGEILFHYRNTHDFVTGKSERDLPVIVFEIIIDENYDEAAARAVAESMEAGACKPIPAAKSAIDALEKVVLDGLTGTETCVVCLENLPPGQQVTRMPCSHMFHGDCIVQWLETSHLCPLCRFQMPTQLNQYCGED